MVFGDRSVLDRILNELAITWNQSFRKIESWCNCEAAEFVPDNNVIHDAGLVDGETIEWWRDLARDGIGCRNIFLYGDGL